MTNENDVLTDIMQYIYPGNTRIVIPGNFKKIDVLNCNSNKSVVTVEFGGSVAQWESVKGKDNLLKTVSARVVKCTDGEWQAKRSALPATWAPLIPFSSARSLETEIYKS